MGDRVSIQFKNGDRLSPVLFSHWGGRTFAEEARKYADALREWAAKERETRIIGPLARLEPRTVLVDFIRAITTGMNRVDSDLYLGCTRDDGDNSDNGHFIIELQSPDGRTGE